MSNAWEVSKDDIRQVLKSHNRLLSDDEIIKIHDELDHNSVEDAVLYYTNFDEQVQAALSEIENQILEMDLIRDQKHFSIL